MIQEDKPPILVAHHPGEEHAVAVTEAADQTHPGTGLLGGHGLELIVFSFGTLIFLLLTARLFWLEYQRTGQWRWQSKTKSNKN